MRYKLIVFDLDETLWTIHQHVMGPVHGPFRLVDSYEARGETASIVLRTGVRALLRNLEGRHKYVSLASRSDPSVCAELLELFEIDPYFVHPQYGWQSKGSAVRNILKALRDLDQVIISAADVLFIDDYPANCDSVRQVGAATLLFGRDIRSIRELLTVLQ